MGEHDYKGFMQDFMIAARFGKAAVLDTYKRAFNEWNDNVEYYAALVLTLNHLIWRFYEQDEGLARLFNALWDKADLYGKEHFKGEDAEYYFRVLD